MHYLYDTIVQHFPFATLTAVYTLTSKLHIICALTLPSTGVIHDLYYNPCPLPQLASPINKHWCRLTCIDVAFSSIPIRNASHPWPVLAGEPCCTDLEYTHLHPAIVSLPEEHSIPDLSHTPNLNNMRTLTLFASTHRYIGIVIPFPILDGLCFHAKAEQHYVSTLTAHYYYTSTPVPNIIHLKLLQCNNGECKM
jgi:hypothetical protein